MSRLNILKLRAPVPVASAPEPVIVRAPESLCRGCAIAHIAGGHNAGEETLFCGLGGWLREVPFAVARCTDYRERSKRGTARVGFGAGV